MYEQEVSFEIGSTEATARVSFNFTKGYPGRYHGLPEDCYPAEPDEWEIIDLYIHREEHGYVKFNELIELCEDEILQALEALSEES